MPALKADDTAIYAVPRTGPWNIFHQFLFSLLHRPEAPTDRLPHALKSKLAEIQNSCAGFRVTSTVCGNGGHSLYVRNSRRVSLHCVHKAADFVVNTWSCAYAKLKDWKGGLSIDPTVVNHVHISKGGREDGIRFCHHGCHRHGRVATLSPFTRVA